MKRVLLLTLLLASCETRDIEPTVQLHARGLRIIAPLNHEIGYVRLHIVGVRDARFQHPASNVNVNLYQTTDESIFFELEVVNDDWLSSPLEGLTWLSTRPVVQFVAEDSQVVVVRAPDGLIEDYRTWRTMTSNEANDLTTVMPVPVYRDTLNENWPWPDPEEVQ